MISALHQLANHVKRVFLRGSIREWWIQKRARQIDEAYLAAISEPRLLSFLPSSDPTPHRTARSGKALDRILFIGDCMWEPNELFPEIRKICHLDVIDLAPILRETNLSPAEAVADCIENHPLPGSHGEPDLILFYARPSILSEEAFAAISNRWTCPLLGLNLDDRVEFFPYDILSSGNDNYQRWINHFDINLTSSLAAMDWYRQRGAAVCHMPQGFRVNPRFSAPPTNSDHDHRFSFLGSWKPERGILVDQLRKHGIEITLFGKDWPETRWVEDPGEIFRRSQINLGIGYPLASGRLANLKGRDIECPAVGACYLTTYCWEITQLFEIGKEILCYRNAEELIELHGYYSRRPEACLEIARNAHRRAHAEHTWEMRLRDVFRQCGYEARQ